MITGKSIIISGPSGSGKSTIVQNLLHNIPTLRFSVSACTRPIRSEETEAKNYYFIDDEKFQSYIEQEKFLEWEKVYEGQYYGTLRSEVEKIWADDYHALFDVDVKGGTKLKKLFPDTSLAIFIKAPTIEILLERLRDRLTESEESIQKRIGRARTELEYEDSFDQTIINNNLIQAQTAAIEITLSFINK